MASSTTVTNPITLSSNNKEKLDKLVKDLSKTERKNGEYYFHSFFDYYQLPQIIRVEQTWNTNLIKNQWLIQTQMFDTTDPHSFMSSLTPIQGFAGAAQYDMNVSCLFMHELRHKYIHGEYEDLENISEKSK
ncbi:unnamed protein product [Adineta steineri]|uniref:Uncharacterized protein n=2 Tax=Adineta steineri TaxID=433720 RepID=A0A819E1I2_9BILA|nr:unnamed protein product [Adineta steineri]